jgi:hypothetical protein
LRRWKEQLLGSIPLVDDGSEGTMKCGETLWRMKNEVKRNFIKLTFGNLHIKMMESKNLLERGCDKLHLMMDVI